MALRGESVTNDGNGETSDGVRVIDYHIKSYGENDMRNHYEDFAVVDVIVREALATVKARKGDVDANDVGDGGGKNGDGDDKDWRLSRSLSK